MAGLFGGVSYKPPPLPPVAATPDPYSPDVLAQKQAQQNKLVADDSTDLTTGKDTLGADNQTSQGDPSLGQYGQKGKVDKYNT